MPENQFLVLHSHISVNVLYMRVPEHRRCVIDQQTGA